MYPVAGTITVATVNQINGSNFAINNMELVFCWKNPAIILFNNYSGCLHNLRQFLCHCILVHSSTSRQFLNQVTRKWIRPIAFTDKKKSKVSRSVVKTLSFKPTANIRLDAKDLRHRNLLLHRQTEGIVQHCLPENGANTNHRPNKRAANCKIVWCAVGSRRIVETFWAHNKNL